jgi:hypothetical protein
MTTTDRDTPAFRLPIPAARETGLRQPSFAMTEKIFAIGRGKCGPVIGRLPGKLIAPLNDMLIVLMGLNA